MKANDIETFVVPSGIKHAFKEIRKYVVGAHCEHNGHGTICTNWDWLDKALKGKEDKIEAKKLRALLKIANAGHSDAFANMLMAEAVMKDKDYSAQMLQNLYMEYPSELFKAVVENKNNFVTNWDETKLVEPKRL